MSRDDEVRARLAARQAEVVRALVADGPAPDGFCREHVEQARAVLRDKQARIARRRERMAELRARGERRAARPWWRRLRGG